LLAAARPGVFFFRDSTTKQRTGDFYIDEDLSITKAILRVLVTVRCRFEYPGAQMGPPLQKMIIISGLVKVW
jgi:hypothetical protein